MSRDDFFEELLLLPDEMLERTMREADELDERFQFEWPAQRARPSTHPLEITFLGALGCRLGMLADGAGGLLVRMHGATFLIDPGPGALSRLVALGASREFSFAELDAILCSHLHPDHTADLLPCIEGMLAAGSGSPRRVIGNPTVVERFSAFSPFHFDQVCVEALAEPGAEAAVGEVIITATPTNHVEEAGRNRSGLGFLLTAGDDAVWISSDTTLHAELMTFLEGRGAVNAVAVVNADVSDVDHRPGRAERCHLLTRDIPEICRALRPSVVVIHHYDYAYMSLRYRTVQATYAQRAVDRNSLGGLVLFAGDGLRLGFAGGELRAVEAVLPVADGTEAAAFATWSRDRRASTRR